MSNVSIKFASINDCELILSFILELAEYEKILHEVNATTETIKQTLFNAHPCAEVVIAYKNNHPAGIAIFYQSYSTFLSRPGLYIDDLYVKPEYRGNGLGTKLFNFLADTAKQRNYGRMEWAVLDWNTKAMDFYKSQGAKHVKDWEIYRLNV